MSEKLRQKVIEKFCDIEAEESLQLLGIDFLDLIDSAIESKINEMTDDELLELLD